MNIQIQAKDKISKKELNLPWTIIMAYFLCCFAVYLFGPWKYAYSVDWRTFLLIISFCVIATIGYKSGIKSYFKNTSVNNAKDRNISTKILQLFILISFVAVCCMLIIKISQNGLSKTGNIFATMAQAYSTTRSEEAHKDQAIQIFYRTAFFFYFSIAVGLYNYKMLSKFYRLLLVLSIFTLSLYTVLYSGQQKQIGDIVILVISVAITKYKPTPINILSKKKIIFTVLVMLVIILFSGILSGRLVMMNMSLHGSASQHYYLNGDSIIFKIMPETAALGFSYFLFYISNGFYGLNLCLQQPFVWTKGLGSCSVIVTILKQYTKINPWNIPTYPRRTEFATGWSSSSVWHTIFPWLASDLTFPGAIILLAIGAYIYGKCWCEIKYQNKWQSIFMFSILNIQWFYMVANNQIFTAKSTFIVFILGLFFWLTRNVKIRVK
jgi:hypothetical protein